jgi:hypothetical protein
MCSVKQDQWSLLVSVEAGHAAEHMWHCHQRTDRLMLGHVAQAMVAAEVAGKKVLVEGQMA